MPKTKLKKTKLKKTKDFEIFVEDNWKFLRSKDCNYNFDLKTGLTMTWGKTEDDDPELSPYGPFIFDCEITTKCKGIDGVLCPYCYKSNNPVGENMSLDTFKKVIKQIDFNHQLTQVAFGLGSTGMENPDLWDMCKFLRERYIIPNGTVAQLDGYGAHKIAMNFGGCAVSYHGDFEVLANTVAHLIEEKDKGINPNATLMQVNIHFMISEETFDDCLKLVKKIKTDDRFYGLNAVVLLGLKKCGRAKSGFNRLSDEKLESLIKLFLLEKIGFGMDSCSANRCANIFKNISKEKIVNLNEDQIKDEKNNLSNILQLIEPCESGIFSSYANVKGEFYPCSFNEKKEYKFNLLDIFSFEGYWDIGLKHWREKLEASNRSCPEYEV